MNRNGDYINKFSGSHWKILTLFTSCSIYLFTMSSDQQVVKAFVVLSEAFQNEDKEKLAVELQDHVKHTTAPYKYPRKVTTRSLIFVIIHPRNIDTNAVNV